MDDNRYNNNGNMDTEPNFILYPSEEQSQDKPVNEPEGDPQGRTVDDPVGKAQEPSVDEWIRDEIGKPGNETKGFQTIDIDKRRRAEKKKLKKKASLSKKAVALLLVLCVLVSGAAGFGGSILASKYYPYGAGSSSSSSSSASKTEYKPEVVTGSKMTVKEINDMVEDSIVEIRTEGTTTDSWMQQYITSGAGSGIIIKENGYIITNNHVIEGSNKIKVTLSNDKEYDAEVIGTDPSTDIAVIKISAKGLKPVTYGDSDKLDNGDLAVVIGNPLGELGGTVTAGIISEPVREVNIEGQNMSLIQTDASINPGNSGGGLFNEYGELVGVIEAKSSGSDVEGLGFAVPVNTAAKVAEQIMSGKFESAGKAFTGMSYGETGSDSGDEGGMEDFFSFGEPSVTYVYIAEVISSNAKKAGFRENDVVLSVDGQDIDSIDTLKSVIQKHKPGDKVKYEILRGNKTMSIKLTLEKTTD
ncbi:MAG: trypsin-like peptidase domain-containing protein [Bacillota bacterium]|nr:trypsin-like peptidase domain-containing protein [Bacillota bacterium]